MLSFNDIIHFPFNHSMKQNEINITAKGGFDKLIEALEYDSLINQEKIGTSKYIWSFKSEQLVQVWLINKTKKQIINLL